MLFLKLVEGACRRIAMLGVWPRWWFSMFEFLSLLEFLFSFMAGISIGFLLRSRLFRGPA